MFSLRPCGLKHIYFMLSSLLWGRRVIRFSGSLIWSKTLMELIFNPCDEFRWRPEGPVSQIHSPHLLVGAPGIFSDLLMFVQMLTRERVAESNGKLPHLFILSKTATYVPEFAMEDLPFARITPFVPEFAVKDLPLGRTLMIIIIINVINTSINIVTNITSSSSSLIYPPPI